MKAFRFSLFRLIATGLVCLVLGVGVGYTYATTKTEPLLNHVLQAHLNSPDAFNQHDMEHHSVTLEIACRGNAFMDADKLLGSLVEIGYSLPANVSEEVKGHLDAMLYVTLGQAREEVSCIKEGLAFGYEDDLIETLRASVELAELRGLGDSVAEIGLDVITVLEQAYP